VASESETSEEERARVITVPEADAGLRLDRFLTKHVHAISRARVQALIRSGAVSTGAGEPACDASRLVRAGETIRLTIPPPEAAAPAAEPMALAVVHEDAHLIVVDKPAGLVVHPAPGHSGGTLVNALLAHCGDSLSGIGGVRRPGIVHRLDKDTSGLLVVAKSDAAHRGLSEQFAAHGADGRLQRAYLALVWGVPERRRGAIDAPLARSASNRTKIAVARGAGGRRAVTHYEVLETFRGPAGQPVASLLRLALETGRTHQIRVHLAHSGHPLLGDRTYGAGFKASISRLGAGARAALEKLDRQALHAAELAFAHPVGEKKLSFASPLPADLEALLAALRAESGRGEGRGK
jgi:23S rRNA pseudouridine1911/1915/1917 synthase